MQPVRQAYQRTDRRFISSDASSLIFSAAQNVLRNNNNKNKLEHLYLTEILTFSSNFDITMIIHKSLIATVRNCAQSLNP